VLCVDEESGIQALDRSAPVLPMMPGMPERRTHDYLRSATTTLFAALDVASGRVIGSLHRRQRAIEFKKFLARIDTEVPADLDVHLICDNLSAHKTPAITAWLAAHPRFHLHFTPTSSSWLNQVERWFALLTDQVLRRGLHRSVQALGKPHARYQRAIRRQTGEEGGSTTARRAPTSGKHSSRHDVGDPRQVDHDAWSLRSLGSRWNRSARCC
jgi:transposase